MPGVTLSGVQVSLARLLKLLAVKGRSPGFDLSSAVVPVVDVTKLVEYDAARMGYVSSDLDQVTPHFVSVARCVNNVGPGESSVVSFGNPANSGVDALVRRIRVENDAGSGITWCTLAAPMAANPNLLRGGAPIVKRKSSSTANAQCSLKTNTGGGVIVPTNVWDENLGSLERLYSQAFAPSLTIFPGETIGWMEQEVIGSRFRVTVEWSERPTDRGT